MSLHYTEGISIIIPTYQEVNNIDGLLHAISSVTFPSPHWEVIIVDDQSTDGTIQLTQKLMNTFPWLKLIVRNQQRSLSAAVIEGFQHAKFDKLVVMDADLSHPPDLIPDLVNALDSQHADFVIGSRYIPEGSIGESWPLSRRLTSRFAASLAKLALSSPIHDPLSGFFSLRKSTFLNADTLHPIGWKIGLELMVKCRCKNIREIPIHFSDRIHDKSKLNWKVIIAYLNHILHLFAHRLRSPA